MGSHELFLSSSSYSRFSQKSHLTPHHNSRISQRSLVHCPVSQVMSSPEDFVVDDREAVFAAYKKVLPDDVRLQAADGDVWANKAFLSARSEYLAAMLDETKFKEGQAGVGDLKLYSKEVVGLVVNYFYTGRLSCKDLSLSSLLYLEELLRKLILLPLSAKVQAYTKEKLRLKLIPMLECLRGLTTAQDLSLETTQDDIFNFIIISIISIPGLFQFANAAIFPLGKWAMTLFSKEELLSLLRRFPLPEVLTGDRKVVVYKDQIVISSSVPPNYEDDVVFCPHYFFSKIK